MAVITSFVISASAGLGGSLLLVPTLAVLMGTKEGVALAAVLLAGNNLFKVAAYRATLPFARAALVVGVLSMGAALGASLLVNAPEGLVAAAIVLAMTVSVIAERKEWTATQRAAAPLLAFGAGATSGFSGTSGPLKGASIRNLGLDRLHFVGAASLASLSGDVVKAGVFARASLLDGGSLALAIAAAPLMFLGTAVGKHLNSKVGERGFAILFWTVMTGYSIRLMVFLA